MKWSKLKQRIEDGFAGCIRGRVSIYATRYTSGSHFMARGWITVDGVQIVNFSTPDSMNKFGLMTPEINERIPEEQRTPGLHAEKGEFSRYDLFDACWAYLNISIADALKDENPLIQAFAMLDKRLGKRRLKNLDPEKLHPLPAGLLRFRLECENMEQKL